MVYDIGRPSKLAMRGEAPRRGALNYGQARLFDELHACRIDLPLRTMSGSEATLPKSASLNSGCPLVGRVLTDKALKRAASTDVDLWITFYKVAIAYKRDIAYNSAEWHAPQMTLSISPWELRPIPGAVPAAAPTPPSHRCRRRRYIPPSLTHRRKSAMRRSSLPPSPLPQPASALMRNRRAGGAAAADDATRRRPPQLPSPQKRPAL